VNVQDRVELPEPVTLVGDSPHEVLLLVRPTTPANPFNPVIVTVEVPTVPTLTVTAVGLETVVKSCTVYVTVAACDRLPAVPVTVTWMVPTEVNTHDSVALPGALMLVGEIVQEVLLVARLTVNGP